MDSNVNQAAADTARYIPGETEPERPSPAPVQQADDAVDFDRNEQSGFPNYVYIEEAQYDAADGEVDYSAAWSVDNMADAGTDTNTMNTDYVYTEGTLYGAEAEMEPDNREIKEAVGRAVSVVPGVLALKGGIGDLFKRDEDLTRGISVHKNGDGTVRIRAKVIARTGYNTSELIRQMTESITNNLQSTMGLVVEKVDIEIAEILSADEFYDRYDPARALH